MLPRPARSGVGASPWRATDVFGHHCSNARKSAAHEQMTLSEHDHMIKTLASDRADQTFDIAVLPRRSRRCRSVANAHRSNAARECLAVDAVPVADEILRRALPAACLGDLPGDPFGGRVRSDTEPQDAPSIMSENQQPVEQPERDRRNHE